MSGKIPGDVHQPRGEYSPQLPEDSAAPPLTGKHPTLSSVTPAEGEASIASTQADEHSSKSEPKPILKRQGRTQKKQRKQARFSETPSLEHHVPTRAGQKQELRKLALDLIYAEKKADIVELLISQRLNDLTTRSNEKKRIDNFEQLCEDLRQECKHLHIELLNTAIEEAEKITDEQFMVYAVVNGTSPDDIEDQIEYLQRRITKLEKTDPKSPKISLMKLQIEELMLIISHAQQESGPTRKSIPRGSDARRPEKSPALWTVRFLLDKGKREDAISLIKKQRNPEVLTKLTTALRDGGYDKELIAVAKKTFLKALKKGAS
ncbi:hypothetical protein ACWJJH_07390 [Endozoicomonadaceae bacterium StTr2]